MDWLNGIPKVIKHAIEGIEIPSLTTVPNPFFAVIFEWTEGYQGIVAGAASKDFGPTMSDETVSCDSVSVAAHIQDAFRQEDGIADLRQLIAFMVASGVYCVRASKFTTIWLFSGSVIVIKLSSQQTEPLFQV
jgi:hypothetical protein